MARAHRPQIVAERDNVSRRVHESLSVEVDGERFVLELRRMQKAGKPGQWFGPYWYAAKREPSPSRRVAGRVRWVYLGRDPDVRKAVIRLAALGL